MNPEQTGQNRTTGIDAQQMIFHLAKEMGRMVRTTLGPKGMDKMLVDPTGDMVITNDGATIMSEANMEHPIAKIIRNLSKTQEIEVGDGTTSCVIIASELIRKAEKLTNKKIHPTTIVAGYNKALKETLEYLDSIKVSIADMPEDEKNNILKNIAMTAMTGKCAEDYKDILGDFVVNGLNKVMKDGKIDMTDIKVERGIGGHVKDSELISGIVLDKFVVHSNMPRMVKDAKIAIIDTGLEVKNLDSDVKININNPMEMQKFYDNEQKQIKDMIDKVIESGANVVFCAKGIDDVAQHFLAKSNIMCLRRVIKEDIERLSKATGARIVTDIKDLSESDLGNAGIVEESKIGLKSMTFVRDCPNANSVTILVKGGTEHTVDETKRAVEDALGAVATVIKSKDVIGGAGAPEIRISKHLFKYADTLSGREQYAVKEFAETMEVIPETLAENAGLDPIDVITEMKASYTDIEGNNGWYGINVFTGKVMDSFEAGVIEPLMVKTQALCSAVEVAITLLRLDDFLVSKPADE